MKLSNVVISNLAIFPYIQDLHSAPGVSFPTSEKFNISIFIWPNGSGKSVFLEIIQQINKTVLFLPYTCDLSRLSDLTEGNSQEFIRLKKIPIHNLFENAKGENKPSMVVLNYMLNADDRNNLQFVYEHQEEINLLIAKYSTESIRFNYKNIWQYIPSYEQIICKIQIDTTTNQSRLLNNNAEDIEKFIFDFFVHFNLLQHCISIHNLLHPEKENHWHALHATMAFIWAYRDLLHFDDTYTIGAEAHQRFLNMIDDIEKSSIKMSQDHLTWLLYMKKRVAYHLFRNHPNATTQTEIEAALDEIDMFKSFRAFCVKYLHRRPIVKVLVEQKGTYQFLFIDDQWNESYLNMLSAWEKSMIWIIFAVYGFNLQDWLLIIEEPELHLHPQLQSKIRDFLEEIAEKFGLQCIMTTHSALMINENNIRHVYRFTRANNVTQIITPGKHYNEEAGKLMQILKFTNTAKLFFVKKIIMVEGETDEYAFGYYLHHLANKSSYWEKILQDFEIVNINGKWWYTRRKKFLRTFGIKSYFIGDRDNVQEISWQQLDMRRFAALATRRSRNGYLSKAEKYQAIIAYLKKFEPFKWDSIKQMIDDLYKKDVFVLQQWDIETYLGMQEKWLEETVSFFHNQFETWLHDPRYDDKRAELDTIFRMIFEEK